MATIPETRIQVSECITRMLRDYNINDLGSVEIPFKNIAEKTGCYSGTMGKREVVDWLEKQMRSKKLKLEKIYRNKRALFKISKI